jgi:hypothetical protein
MASFNLKKFKPDTIDIEGRDSTKLAYWILQQNPDATYQDAADAAAQLGIGFSGRSWGSARQALGMASGASKAKKGRKKKGRRKGAKRGPGRPPKAAAAAAPAPAPARASKGGSPIEVALQRVESAERELAELRVSLERMRAALLG